jgi:hypothetical protein
LNHKAEFFQKDQIPPCLPLPAGRQGQAGFSKEVRGGIMYIPNLENFCYVII